VVPALIGARLATRVSRRLLVGWTVGGLATLAGIGASVVWDLPTGAAIVALLGLALAVALALGAARDHPARTGRAAVGLAGAALGGAAALLVLFPGWNHGWLTLVEARWPGLETAFLTPAERAQRREVLDDARRGEAEVLRLTGLREAARLGDARLDAERMERLRQFLVSRQEIAAGDRFVLAHLRGRARARQHLVLGLPLLGLGAAAVWWAWPRPPGAAA
jgi:hypothetical protein